MRLGLTYDLQRNATDEREAEFDPPGTVAMVCTTLHELGHEVRLMGNAHDLLSGLPQHPAANTDLVFNIAEGARGRCREAWVPTLLEVWDIPYVGSDPLALSLGLDKVASKRLAVAAGIPTPAWIAVDRPAALKPSFPLSFPVIVKPRYQGSGIGIDEGAVVHDLAGLARRSEWLCTRWPEPFLIEELVPHGELTVHVIGNDPPVAYPPIQRALDPASRLSCHVVRSGPRPWDTPLELSESLEAEAGRVARVMFDALGCHDIARVDLRVDESGRVYFLEVNPLPSFDPEGSFGLLAQHLGLTYAQLIGRVLEAARSRTSGRSRSRISA